MYIIILYIYDAFDMYHTHITIGCQKIRIHKQTITHTHTHTCMRRAHKHKQTAHAGKRTKF